MGGRYTFIVPIGLYLIFLGYLVATQEKFVVEKIDSGVELLPSQLKDLANILL